MTANINTRVGVFVAQALLLAGVPGRLKSAPRFAAES